MRPSASVTSRFSAFCSAVAIDRSPWARRPGHAGLLGVAGSEPSPSWAWPRPGAGLPPGRLAPQPGGSGPSTEPEELIHPPHDVFHGSEVAAGDLGRDPAGVADIGQ